MQDKVSQSYNGSEIYDFLSHYVAASTSNSTIAGTRQDALEVEYKIRVDQKSFIELLNSFRGQEPTLEQTTNAIYKIETGVKNERVNFVVSKNYATDKISKYTKRRLLDANCDDFANIMMSASIETPFGAGSSGTGSSAKPAGATKVELYRIKNRLSFTCGDWRYDFTQTTQHLPSDRFFNENSVKISANSIFGTTAKHASAALIDEFIKSCDNPVIKSFELEVELIAPLKPIHISTHSFLDCLGSNQQFVKERLYYNLIISGLAYRLGVNPDTRSLSIKRLLNAAETLTKTLYNSIFPPIGWYLSRKADGERGVMMIMGNGTIYLLTNKVYQLNNFDDGILINEFYGAAHGRNPADGSSRGNRHYDKFIPLTVIEGELVEGKKQNSFLVWECLALDGKTVIDKQFADRNDIAALCCERFANLPVIVKPKEQGIITEDIHTSVKRFTEHKFDYPDDGYVLTEPNKNYYNTRCFKIKTSNTIDFLIIESPRAKGVIDRQDGHQDARFLLFCSISPHTLESMRIQQLPFYSKLFRINSFKGRVPVHFCPPDNPHAYVWHPTKDEAKLIRETVAKQDPTRPWVIGELDYVLSDSANAHSNMRGTWKLERIRHDRYNEPNYYGNDFTKVALHNWEAIQNPVKVEELHMSIANYFKTGKDEYYHAQTTAMSFVKYRVFELLFNDRRAEVRSMERTQPRSSKDNSGEPADVIDRQDGHRVIDFAFGKGQDLNKYIQHKVTRLLGIDIDRVALSEALTRYYEALNRRNNDMGMSLAIMQQDLSAKHSLIFDRINDLWLTDPVSGATNRIEYPQYLVCSLALHYFIRDINELTNFASLLKSLMSSGSKFMYTTFDGKRVFDLLAANDGEWIAHVEGSVKYRIVRKYTNTEFGEFGQTIQVKLPFTNDELYEENLVNVDSVNFAFTQMGMKVVAHGSFSDFFDSLAAEQAPVWRRLNDEDKKFISLYQYTILSA